MGITLYLNAVEKAFGGDVDYAMLVKIYGEAPKEEKRLQPGRLLRSEKARHRR